MSLCPCASEKDYQDCCGPMHKGERSAATAEELLRSRYSAFVKGEIDYIFATHHKSTADELDRGETEEWSKESEWKGLRILEVEAGGEDDQEGRIEFEVQYNLKGKDNKHHELSLFKKEEGKWFFVDGSQVGGTIVRQSPKVGRNDPCPCGSGKKFKKCCA